VRVRARLNRDANNPVCGFLIRDRHGIHVYGTNTEIQRADFGFVRSGEVIEATFAFNCWLGTGEFSITAAIHSASAISFDWVDDVVFFRVMSAIPIEGAANLNADVTTRKVILRADRVSANL
jgi:flavin-binding protein dodecin